MPTLAQWEIVGQVSSAFAALFAFLTVFQAAAQWRLSRRGATYDLVVLDPIRLAADQFVEDSVCLITDRVQLMQAFTDEKDVTQMVGQLIGEFNDGYFTFKSRVSRVDGSWPFDDLSSSGIVTVTSAPTLSNSSSLPFPISETSLLHYPALSSSRNLCKSSSDRSSRPSWKSTTTE